MISLSNLKNCILLILISFVPDTIGGYGGSGDSSPPQSSGGWGWGSPAPKPKEEEPVHRFYSFDPNRTPKKSPWTDFQPKDTQQWDSPKPLSYEPSEYDKQWKGSTWGSDSSSGWGQPPPPRPTEPPRHGWGRPPPPPTTQPPHHGWGRPTERPRPPPPPPVHHGWGRPTERPRPPPPPPVHHGWGRPTERPRPPPPPPVHHGWGRTTERPRPPPPPTHHGWGRPMTTPPPQYNGWGQSPSSRPGMSGFEYNPYNPPPKPEINDGRGPSKAGVVTNLDPFYYSASPWPQWYSDDAQKSALGPSSADYGRPSRSAAPYQNIPDDPRKSQEPYPDSGTYLLRFR
jgi:hypothetical protein